MTNNVKTLSIVWEVFVIIFRTFLWTLVTLLALVIAFNFNLKAGLCFLTTCAIGWYWLLCKM